MQRAKTEQNGINTPTTSGGKVSVKISKTDGASTSDGIDTDAPRPRMRVPRSYRREFAALRSRQFDRNRFSTRTGSPATASDVSPVRAVPAGSQSSSASEGAAGETRQTAASDDVPARSTQGTESLLEERSSDKPTASVPHSKNSVSLSAPVREEGEREKALDQREEDIQRELAQGLQEFTAGRIECRWSDWSELVCSQRHHDLPNCLPSILFALLTRSRSPTPLIRSNLLTNSIANRYRTSSWNWSARNSSSTKPRELAWGARWSASACLQPTFYVHNTPWLTRSFILSFMLSVALTP